LAFAGSPNRARSLAEPLPPRRPACYPGWSGPGAGVALRGWTPSSPCGRRLAAIPRPAECPGRSSLQDDSWPLMLCRSWPRCAVSFSARLGRLAGTTGLPQRPPWRAPFHGDRGPRRCRGGNPAARSWDCLHVAERVGPGMVISQPVCQRLVPTGASRGRFCRNHGLRPSPFARSANSSFSTQRGFHSAIPAGNGPPSCSGWVAARRMVRMPEKRVMGLGAGPTPPAERSAFE